MKIYLATDHAGFTLKEKVKEFLQTEGCEVIDCGAYAYDKNDDYPDFIVKAASEVSKDPKNNRGVVFGGSGQGEAMVANKYKNVRAVVYYGGETKIISLSREHNNANVLSIGARFVDEKEVLEVVKQWLETPFSNEERHMRRIEKINKIEC
ncbi:MAG: RpiB/LacA/LacB family sugar-phosphate isomerase [Candidatus Levyibacteriota bacterium]|nr:MAG: RpiB/LacA/LacB family sugar-phosphate isomerase [Candidatus Levybacteria bacterium]